MTALTIQFITYAIINLFNAIIGFVVWLRYRNDVYRAALVFWSSTVLYFVLLGAINPKTELEILLGSACGFAMLSGMAYFQQTLFKIRMPWPTLVILHFLSVLFSLFLDFKGFPFELKALPLNLTVSAPVLVAIVKSYAEKVHKRSFYSALSLASFTIYILYVQTFPFLRMNTAFAPYGYAIGLALSWPLILSVWLTVIEKAQQEKYDLEIQKAKLETRLQRARLRELKDRMSPHFLFNALNSIRRIIPVNTAQAEEAVIQLSDIYRFLTDRSAQDLILFEEEWSLVLDYLKIQEMRFGDRFSVMLVKKGDFSAVRIPPLTIQPLVENIFKHVLERTTGRIHIALNAEYDGKSVRVIVENTGEKPKVPLKRTATFTAIQDRLEHYYDHVDLGSALGDGKLRLKLELTGFKLKR